MNYIKELCGKHYLEPSKWEERNRKSNLAFKARLAALPKAEAIAICRDFVADASLPDNSGKQIAAEYLAANT